MLKQLTAAQSSKHKEINNLISCAERELRLRKHIYPNLVARGKKTASASEFEIKCMKEILVILHLVNRLNFLDQSSTITERMIFENTHPDMKNN